MLKVVHEESEPNAIGAPASASLLDEIVRDGARQMLAAALQAEVAAYIQTHAGEVDEHGRRLVVRNGYHAEREVTTAAGAIAVRAPRVNDKRNILPPSTPRVEPGTHEQQSPRHNCGAQSRRQLELQPTVKLTVHPYPLR